MLIEIGAPASLPLGLVKYENDAGSKTAVLGLTVQHPPIQIFAQAHSKLQITGARSDKGYEQAVRFLQYHQLKQQAEIEIESTIPNQVGLGSEALMGLSLAKALSWIHDLPSEKQEIMAMAKALGLEPQQALETWGFERGGLLLVDTEPDTENSVPQLLRRQEIEHPEKEAWAFVFYFPDIPEGTSETLEADRWAALLKATPYLSSETGRLVDEELWPAVENNNIETFGKSLLTLHQMNEEALVKAGFPLNIMDEDQAVLDLMRDSGAVAWGQNLMGLSCYGLIKGGQASRILRKKLRDHVGFFGGLILATIADNRGMAEAIKDENLVDNKMTPLRLNLPK